MTKHPMIAFDFSFPGNPREQTVGEGDWTASAAATTTPSDLKQGYSSVCKWNSYRLWWSNLIYFPFPPLQCEPTLLPEPNHVMLNHLYALSIKDGVMVLSATHRYRKKYVTTLLYKPIDTFKG